MARRVFLHIGAPKSGTSYLQDRLARNRDSLETQGLRYPELPAGDHFQAALDLIERPWAGELERARGQWQALSDVARKSDQDVVISHEILAAAEPAQVARAVGSLGEAEVHVVLTARDLARQLPAEWQEMVKHRRSMRFERFAREVVEAPRTASELWFWRVQSIPDVLTRWATGLTPDQVHVVTVPPAGAPADTLWNRFGSVLGLDPASPYLPSELANASLGIAEISALRRLNRRLRQAGVSRETYVHYVRELVVREVYGTSQDVDNPVLPARYRPFVDEVTDEWLEWIVGSGVHVVGDLDDLRPRWPDSDVDLADPDQPQPTRVAQAALDALAAVLIEIDNPRSEGRGARRIAQRLLGHE
ncbi:hypothetical protein [Nocardioides terrisoli]|uniref:hypothetical protein n=1 Tax=Nocardioides terrisoli TaxID=3388267 RepID=UPI00287B72DE|nr:hypothetical protein [Nocardioides marmorisolisilvae]